MLFSQSIIFIFFFTIMLNHLARFSNTKLNRRFLILFYSILGLSFLKLDIQLGNYSLHYMYYFSTVLCTIMNSDIQLCNSSYLLTKKTLHSCMYVLGLKKFETGLLTVQWEYTTSETYFVLIYQCQIIFKWQSCEGIQNPFILGHKKSKIFSQISLNFLINFEFSHYNRIMCISRSN